MMVTCLDGCRVGTLPDGDKWQTGHQSAAQAVDRVSGLSRSLAGCGRGPATIGLRTSGIRSCTVKATC